MPCAHMTVVACRNGDARGVASASAHDRQRVPRIVAVVCYLLCAKWWRPLANVRGVDDFVHITAICSTSRIHYNSFLSTWYGTLLALASPDLRGQTMLLEVEVRTAVAVGCTAQGRQHVYIQCNGLSFCVSREIARLQ